MPSPFASVAGVSSDRTGRYARRGDVTSLSDISVVRVPARSEGAAADGPSESAWAPLDPPQAGRSSPLLYVALALLAGVAAMALGALAVLSAARSDEDRSSPATATVAPGAEAPSIERRVLALVAKK